jgi:type III restriction enzyme
MAGFKFERNLPHQVAGVESILKVFDGAQAKSLDEKAMAVVANPLIKHDPGYIFCDNIRKLKEDNHIKTKSGCDSQDHVIDIMMETGTGKTYTYTKAMLELHRQLGIHKFVVVVPTLSIKAGTVNFLKAKATGEHFRQEYGTNIKTYVVESQKSKKNKKAYMPQAVREFIEANNSSSKSVHVLIINAGMINSDTMTKKFDVSLFDKYNTPFGAIASTHPFTIIDEPHKFPSKGKTYENIQKFESQFIFRFGATFNDEFHHLIYQLSAVDAFNNNLVKGVVTHVEEFDAAKDAIVTLKDTDGSEATFELNENGKKRKFKVGKKESMAMVHPEMRDLLIESLNKTVVVLSNGLELKRGNRLNPYSYAESLQDKMMQEAIANHFEIERDLMSREVRIKPLTLFFIDDIEGYREGNDLAGSLKEKFERMAKAYIEKEIKIVKDERYKEYLQSSLKDISLIHGGYFSKDNSEKDEKIEKEITEILHDKEALLSLKNPRRFIFSKWTLREGWDNPNVFQICKLRSSGSTTSKLQEVGRGLRLPVNEYMSRVKEEIFDLHYFVDFTEKTFVDTLISEINEKSGAFSSDIEPDKLTEELIEKITEAYGINEDLLLESLDDAGAIKRNNDFKEGGYEVVVTMYPDAFTGVGKNKVRNAGSKRDKVSLRVGKYDELKSLWESINQKVILEYKIEDESKFEELFKGYLEDNIRSFKPQGVKTKIGSINFEEGVAFYKEIESVDDEILPISTMGYKAFLIELSKTLSLNMQTLHQVFISIREQLDINFYLNQQTIRIVRAGFNKYLLDHAFSDFSIEYNKITNEIHPTKFTDKSGKPLHSINASDIGVKFSDEKVANSYFLDRLYYDSDLEKLNIGTEIKEVTVFTKIPKNSIKIPVAGGGTYSPDFAYVIKSKDGKKKLHLIVETKDKTKRDLLSDESQKIKHAQILFGHLSDSVNIEFKTQMRGTFIKELIKEIRDF